MKKVFTNESLTQFVDEIKAYIQNLVSEKSNIFHKHTTSDITDLDVSLNTRVPVSRAINGKFLSEDISLTPSDIMADEFGSAESALVNAKAYTNDIADTKSDKGHIHDDMYYTEGEIDAKVSDIYTSIANIIDGTVIVAKANNALTSDFATASETAEKATMDDAGNSIKETYETKFDSASKLGEAKSYADGIKNDLLNGAGEAYDTLKELGDLIDDNVDAIDALEIIATGKADKSHIHGISDVTDLQGVLNEKASLDVATSSSDGLMSCTDKIKLDDMIVESNIYTQNDEPLDAVDGDIWITLDEDTEIVTKSYVDNFKADVLNSVETTKNEMVDSVNVIKTEIINDVDTTKTEIINDVNLAKNEMISHSSSFTRKNLLDNWYFKNPVNQREVSGTLQMTDNGLIEVEAPDTIINSSGYFLDRWKLTSGTVQITSNGLILNGTMIQILEFAVGQTTNASVLTSDGLVDGSYDDSTKTFSVTATGEIIIAAKLELWNTQTLATEFDGEFVLNEIPDYAEQLSRCQRYYFLAKKSHRFPGHVGGELTDVSLVLYTPVPMRTIPTIISDANFNFATPDGPVSGSTTNSLTFSTMHSNQIRLSATMSKNIKSQTYASILCWIVGDTMIQFIADL